MEVRKGSFLQMTQGKTKKKRWFELQDTMLKVRSQNDVHLNICLVFIFIHSNHSPTHPPTHSPTNSLTRSFAYSFTYFSPTHSSTKTSPKLAKRHWATSTSLATPSLSTSRTIPSPLPWRPGTTSELMLGVFGVTKMRTRVCVYVCVCVCVFMLPFYFSYFVCFLLTCFLIN